jgi:hypothetical protein
VHESLSGVLSVGQRPSTTNTEDTTICGARYDWIHQSHPGRTEANDLPEAGSTDIVFEDIFRVSGTEGWPELAM